MRESIIEKLRAILSGEIDSECKVVYLLAESRKLLESYPPDGSNPFALKLYFHWALHIDLDYPGTTPPFLVGRGVSCIDSQACTLAKICGKRVAPHGWGNPKTFAPDGVAPALVRLK